MKILVAEDSLTMRKVMEMTFAGEDAEVVVVASGHEAVERARGFAPDVIFADASMSDLDGFALAQAVREDAGLSHIPVVVMGSQQVPYDEARGAQVGASAGIAKPFDTQAVIDQARTLAAQGAGAHQAATFSSAPPSSSSLSAVSSMPAPVSETASSIPLSANVPESSPIELAPQVAESQPAHAAPPPLPPEIPSYSAPPSGAYSSPPEVHVSDLPSAPPGTLSSAPASARISSMVPTGAGTVSSEVVAAGMSDRLADLGLTPEQVEGVLKLSAEVVERVVWEVVPELAETMIREELQRLVAE